MPARKSRRTVGDHRGEFDVASRLAFDAGAPLELAHPRALADELDLEIEQATRFDGGAEFGVLDRLTRQVIREKFANLDLQRTHVGKF